MSSVVPLHVCLLGKFSVTLGERPVPDEAWRSRTAANLLKLLALAPGHRLHWEQATELLWPERTPKDAANRLQRALHILRHILEPDRPARAPSAYVSLRDGILALESELVSVDIDAFEAAAAAGGDIAAREMALARYTGDLLPNDPFEDWALLRRDQLREQYVRLLLEAAELYKSGGQHGRTERTLARVIATDPTREEAHVALMCHYASTGRRAAALRQYRQLREVLRRDVDAEPDAATQRLYRELLAGSSSTPRRTDSTGEASATPPTNLPAPLTSFVGRQRELASIQGLLRKSRLLTLTGPGGVGKTRLAVEAATAVQSMYPDGVWLADLVAETNPALVTSAVARAVGVREAADRPLAETLVADLRTRHMLIILDNCEHVIDAGAQLAHLLLQSCPRVTVVATSRTPLNITGETVWPVPPLSVPAPGEAVLAQDLESYEATRLFLERMHVDRPQVTLEPEQALSLADLCRQLEGLPLAIELAAVRTRSLSLNHMAARLDNILALLTQGDRTTAPRHQTMRGVIDWSYSLLAERERAVFRRLAVFHGEFSLEAAEAIAGHETTRRNRRPGGRSRPGSPDPRPPDVLDTLAAVVDHSLVIMEERSGVARYRLLEPIRQYGAEKLQEAGEADSTRDVHLAWYVALAERLEADLMGGSGQAAALALLNTENANLRAALHWSIERAWTEPGLRLGGVLWQFWSAGGHFTEGLRWLETLLRMDDTVATTPETGRTLPIVPGAPPLAPPAAGLARAKSLTGAGVLTWLQGDLARAKGFYDERLRLSTRLNDQAGVGLSYFGLAIIAQLHGDYVTAAGLYEKRLELGHRLGDRRAIASSLVRLAGVACDLGLFGQAAAQAEESLELYRQLKNQWGMADATMVLAIVAREHGDYERAASMHGDELTLRRNIRHQWGIARALDLLGQVALRSGDPMQAEALHEQGLALAREIGDRWIIASTLRNAGLAASCLGEGDRARRLLEESLRCERELGHPQGIAFTLAGLGRTALSAEDWPAAEACFRESLRLQREMGVQSGVADCLDGLAAVKSGRGQARRAAWFAGSAMALRETLGMPLPPIERTIHDQFIAAVRGHLGPRAYSAAWLDGRRQPIGRVVAAALAPDPPGTQTGTARRNTPGTAELSHREREVTALITRGRTNREIGAELGISERTVDTHVGHILRKLGVSSRADVAVPEDFVAP